MGDRLLSAQEVAARLNLKVCTVMTWWRRATCQPSALGESSGFGLARWMPW
jgi:DNA-directed RNA polymerase specialized sigma24 family protein